MAKKDTQHRTTLGMASTTPATLAALPAGDARRSWRGPSAEGPGKFRALLSVGLGPYQLMLTTVPEAQLRQVRATRFQGEGDYCRRVQGIKNIFSSVLAPTEFTHEDLGNRLERCQSLDDLIVTLANLISLVQQTSHLEWSELIELCDIVVKDVEAQLDRPILDPELRQQLSNVISVPLETWQSRQAGIQARKTENESIRSETREEMEAQIAALRAQVEELQARLGAAGRATVVDTPPVTKKLATATANKQGRRRDRKDQ